MKKVIFVVVLTVMCMSLFAAQWIPYGSARLGYWYNMLSEEWTGSESRMTMDMNLQPNSRFGVNFNFGDLTANVEFGYNNGDANVRHLWAKQSFGTWSLLAGLTEDGTNEAASQVGFNDNMLRGGFGAVYSGRNPLVRFEMDNGFYAALIQPNTNILPQGARGSVDALIPKINLGWRFDLGQVRLHPTFAFQMYQFNDDFGPHDGDVMALLGAVTADYRVDAWSFRGHLNFGLNIQQMGYDVPFGAVWLADNETEDQMSLGGFVHVGFDTSPTINVALGVGFAQFDKNHDGLDWQDSHQNLGVYAQGTFNIFQNLKIIPEVGYLMVDMELDDVPSLIYFGTQLRFDF